VAGSRIPWLGSSDRCPRRLSQIKCLSRFATAPRSDAHILLDPMERLDPVLHVG